MAITKQPTTPAVFSRVQLVRLTRTLDSDGLFDDTLPGLEDAVRGHKATVELRVAERKCAEAARRFGASKRDVAKARAATAGELEHAARVLGYALDQMEPLIREAFLRGDVPFCSLADLASTRTLKQRWPGVRRFLAGMRNGAARLEQAARHWREHETQHPKGQRGRPEEDMWLLASWVGVVLARAGIKLTCGERDRWAETTRVVFEAAGVAGVPKFLAPTLKRARQHMKPPKSQVQR